MNRKTFTDELAVIGISVFDGKSQSAYEGLLRMNGNDTKAIVILNYCNNDYGDACLN